MKINPTGNQLNNQVEKFQFYKEDKDKLDIIKRIFERVKNKQSLIIIEPVVTETIEE